MEIITPIQKLDAVLDFLKTQKSYLNHHSVDTGLRKVNIELDADDLIRIKDKLINDGYLIERKTNTLGSSIDPVYLISYSGYLFHGYIKQQAIDDLILCINAKNESRKSRNDHRLVVGTWFAGIAALLLLLWQVFLYFYPVHTNYPYWIWQTIPK